MAKSKIIKELANSSIDTMTALKRAKVILSELNNEKILNWINYEIVGYPDDINLPSYRKTKGNLLGTLIIGTIDNFQQITNVPLSLNNIPEDLQDYFQSIHLTQGVNALKQTLENSKQDSREIIKIISADFLPMLNQCNSNPIQEIISARLVVGSQFISNIFAVVENKLLDILLLLQKEFGNLDELDLDTTSKSQDELQTITDKIIVILYNDNSVTIGNENKIKNSNIASKIENQQHI